ncbi:MAG: cyclase family protein [Ignavibacteria bacterium]|nr:cyclase family protein [Ignavibacteria bacterium]
MKHLLPIIIVSLLAGCGQEPSQFTGRIIDLSYAFDSTTVYWPTEKGFVFEKGPEGVTPKGYFYTANRFWTPEHGGTHIDAPIHFFKDRERMDELQLDKLIGPGLVVDVSDKCSADRDYQVQVSDFEAWEKKHGIPVNDHIVLLRTGFGNYYPDRVKYMGTDERGEVAVAKLRFPGLHPDAAKWLVKERKIKAIGLDTPSIDYGQSTMFGSHVALYEQSVSAIENVANLDQLPERGFTVIALPMKIKGGSGGPVRIIAVMNP